MDDVHAADVLPGPDGEGPAALPLSVLIDRMAGPEGRRDEHFVRAFGRWLGEKARHLQLEVVDRLGLVDVVVTFKMKGHVRLVVTGYPPDSLPGAVTLTIDEHDFPFVNLVVHAAPVAAPYDVCTLDYSLAGRRVRVKATGAEGVLVVAATVGVAQENRVRLADGQVVTLAGDDLELLDR